MATDPWITSRDTEVHATPTLDLGAQQVKAEVDGHPSIAGLLRVDWLLGSRTLVSLNGTAGQLRDLLARSLGALDGYKPAEAAGEEAR